jgi:hypothetical protein
MLTRAFLLLLAMMTGLSAAQAADVSRPPPDRAEFSKSIAKLAQESAHLCVARSAHLQPVAAAHLTFQRSTLVFHARSYDAVTNPCVVRSDRRRE